MYDPLIKLHGCSVNIKMEGAMVNHDRMCMSGKMHGNRGQCVRCGNRITKANYVRHVMLRTWRLYGGWDCWEWRGLKEGDRNDDAGASEMTTGWEIVGAADACCRFAIMASPLDAARCGIMKVDQTTNRFRLDKLKIE